MRRMRTTTITKGEKRTTEGKTWEEEDEKAKEEEDEKDAKDEEVEGA